MTCDFGNTLATKNTIIAELVERLRDSEAARVKAEADLATERERLDTLERLLISGADVTCDAEGKIPIFFIQREEEDAADFVWRGDGNLRSAIDAARKPTGAEGGEAIESAI